MREMVKNEVGSSKRSTNYDVSYLAKLRQVSHYAKKSEHIGDILVEGSAPHSI